MDKESRQHESNSSSSSDADLISVYEFINNEFVIRITYINNV